MAWYEDWFDSDAYELVYHERDLEEAERLADLIERTVRPAPGAEVLDVGTGRGRHARVLARRGYRVTGVDLSPRALETARRRARRDGVDVAFVEGDMRRLPFRDAFDGVVNLFTSFGFFTAWADHEAAVASMARALRPGGWLVQDFLNAPAVAAGLVPSDERTAETPAGTVHVRQERRIRGDRVEKAITLHRGGDAHAFRESVALLTRADFERLYAAAGLRLERTFGDYGGGPLSPASPRLILVARRPAGPSPPSATPLPPMQDALTYAHDHADAFVGQLQDWLRIPSISTDPDYAADTRRAADWLADDLRRIGFEHVAVMPTGSDAKPGHPMVFARHGQDPSKPTVLVYGHYDVQPPDPLELWHSEPFDPVIKGDTRTGTVVARGASDDKGQAFMHVKAAEAYLQTGTELPVNLKLMIEGEEESGSVNLAPWIESHKELLKADVVLISDTSLFAPGVPSIAYGLRGLAYVEVELQGPTRDLHSGVYGGGVENPVNALCRMIGALHDADHRVTVEGFYDNVRALTDEERETYRQLPFDEAEWQREIGVPAPKSERGYSVLEGTTARPTLDVNGIWGGYTGKGAKTVLPSKATAKISCRLVPDQGPEEITEKLRRHFERHAPETMRLTFRDLHGGHGAIVDTSAPAMQAAADALEGVFGQRPFFTREGGSIPVVADFKRLLGLDTVLMGFGLDSDSIHSPNEAFGLDRFHQGIAASVRFLDAYARQAAGGDGAVRS